MGGGIKRGGGGASRIAPLSQQTALIAAANRGQAGWFRTLQHHLQPLQGMVQAKRFAVLPCEPFNHKLIILGTPGGSRGRKWDTGTHGKHQTKNEKFLVHRQGPAGAGIRTLVLIATIKLQMKNPW